MVLTLLPKAKRVKVPGIRERFGKRKPKAAADGTTPKPKGTYNARGERIDGHWFASAAEAERYQQLRRMEAAGRIERLEMQVRYPLAVNGKHIAAYLADFRYAVLDERGRTIKVVVEDVKGMVTDVYRLKHKLLGALYPLHLTEIPAKKIREWEGVVP
jgi:hypothetical protein